MWQRGWLLGPCVALAACAARPARHATTGASSAHACAQPLRITDAGLVMCGDGLGDVGGDWRPSWQVARREKQDDRGAPLLIVVGVFPRTRMADGDPRYDQPRVGFGVAGRSERPQAGGESTPTYHPSWLFGNRWELTDEISPARALVKDGVKGTEKRFHHVPSANEVAMFKTTAALVQADIETGESVPVPYPRSRTALVRVYVAGEREIVVAAEWPDQGQWRSVVEAIFDDLRFEAIGGT